MSAAKHGYEKPYIDKLIDAVNENGFIILENLISSEAVDYIRIESDPFLKFDGRTEFEGHKRRRISSVIEMTYACKPLAEHPLVLALLDRLFMPNYLLSQLQVISVMPGEVRQPLHHGGGFYPIARPRKPFGAALIWAIDDFTE